MDVNDHPVHITLTVEQINALLSALGNLPYAGVAPLISLIVPQAQRQVDEFLAANPPPPKEEAE